MPARRLIVVPPFAKERHLVSTMIGSNALVVASILDVLLPDAATALDVTYGSGKFWSKKYPTGIALTAHDLNPARAPHGPMDFRSLAYEPGSFDVVIFDPPFQCNPGKGKPGVMSQRFSAYRDIEEMEAAVRQGVRSAWATARLGVIVKVQDHIHATRLVHMTRWVQEEVPADLYQQVNLLQRSKVRDPKWTRQLSAWANHSSFLVFRKDGAVHKPRPYVRSLEGVAA